MAQVLFSWIHLSDIHFGHGDAQHGWDQRLVLSQLQADVTKLQQKTDRPEGSPPQPDAIFVTGDIAFSGGARSPNEYTAAKTWLDALASAVNVQPKDVFVVPGNHDVSRGTDRQRNVGRLLTALRSGEDSLDTALNDKADRAILAERMQGYLEFATNFAPFCLRNPLPPLTERLFWRETIQARAGLRVRLVGLNSALLSADNYDEGKLQLGTQQIQMALAETPTPGELVVVLTHHPLRPWLSDGKDAEAWIQSHAHVHIFGHVHDADFQSVRHGSRKAFVRMIAGASHAEKDAPGVPPRHGYNLAAIVRENDGSIVLRIWPRRWVDKHKEFRADMDMLDDGQTSTEHALPIKVDGPDTSPAIFTRPIANGETRWLTGGLMSIWSGGSVAASRLHFDVQDAQGKTIELKLAESRVYHLGRGPMRTNGKTPNDCVIPMDAVSRDAAAMERIEGRWFIRNTSDRSTLFVNLEPVPPGKTHSLVHGCSVTIGQAPAVFQDGRFRSAAPMSAVDARTGLLSNEGLRNEVAFALARHKTNVLVAFHFGPDDVQSACIAARILHEAEPSVPIGRIETTVAMMLEDAANMGNTLEVLRRAGVVPHAAGYLTLGGSSTEAGARVESVLGALARLAAVRGSEGLVDLSKYSLQTSPVEELAQLARDARSTGGGMGLLLLDEFERYGALGEAARAAVELELREYLGRLLQPNDRITSVGPGAIVVATRNPVDRLLREVTMGWRTLDPIVVGKIELERSLRVFALDESMVAQLVSHSAAFLREMGTGTNAQGLPTPMAHWVDAAQGALNVVDQASGLVRALESTWRLLGCTLVTAYWAARKGEPLPKERAGISWPAWAAVTLAVAEALRTERGRIGELAGAVWQGWHSGTAVLRLATEQAASLSSMLSSPFDARALARATASLKLSLDDALAALRTLRAWSLVAVRGTTPADLAGEILRVDCVDFTGPQWVGTPRRQTVSGVRVLPFVYLVRWTEGVVIPLEPLVRYVQVPGTNRMELVFVENIPSEAGFYAYTPMTGEGRMSLEVAKGFVR